MGKLHVRKDDKVQILAGKDKGKTGKVVTSFPKVGKVLVDGINMATKHKKPRKQGESGGIVKVAMPLAASKVMFVCPHCGKPTRVGRRKLNDGKSTRYCKKCGIEA
ncbi:MAG: 50S ribosomal protein L24 [Clostridiales bacterium]|jgi:large subunit ribosomal protein L24|nr:50S ribosomal protein L24 [Clostridiales bacterium]